MLYLYRMKKEFITINKITVGIVVLFSICMGMTYFSDFLQSSGFFGDSIRIDTNYGPDSNHDWGARHYFYFWMCILLFISSLVRIVLWCISDYEI